MGKKWPEMVVNSPTNSFVLFLSVQTLIEEKSPISDFLLWSSFKLYVFFFQATTEKNSFTKQVKKGLSNIVNLSRGTVSSSSSEVNAKKIKLAAAVASTTKAQVLQSSLSASLKKKTKTILLVKQDTKYLDL